MAFKGLFVGVYASNGGIKAMFLPVLYLLLSAPLISVLIYYSHIKTEFLNNLLPSAQYWRLVPRATDRQGKN